MSYLCKRNNNAAVMIAIYCSMPWLFFSNSHAQHRQHGMVEASIALCLVLGVALAAFFVCRKRRTAA